MKRKMAKEILAESFREVAINKSIDKITIQEIVDNCGYSPATFYRNFKDKYDLVAWDHTRGVQSIMEKIDSEYTWRQSLEDGAEWFYAQKDYLANLIAHTSGHDSFVRYMIEINFDALTKYIISTGKTKKLTAKEELYARLYCLGTVSITCEWILGKHHITPQEMAEIYENSLPWPLKGYLT